MEKILFILADGFEEIEALLPVDFLRRLNFKLTLAGLSAIEVTGSHGITVKTDKLLKDASFDFDALVLPGGMPGSINLRDNAPVINMIKRFYKEDKLIAAVCAAPIALDKAGILQGKKHTAHPSVKDSFKSSNCTENRIEIDNNIITGKGPGVSAEFALAIAKYLGKEKEGQKTYIDMFFNN